MSEHKVTEHISNDMSKHFRRMSEQAQHIAEQVPEHAASKVLKYSNVRIRDRTNFGTYIRIEDGPYVSHA